MTTTTEPGSHATSGLSAADDFERIRARSQAHLTERLPDHLARLRWDHAALAAHRTRALASLLAHAVRHSAFHRDRLATVDLAAVDPQDLSSLPVMTKTDLMAHYDEVVTDPRLTRARVEEHLAATRDRPLLIDDAYVCLASGGSSGIRGIYAWHWSALTDFALGMLRVPLSAMVAAGGPPAGGLSVGMVTADSAVHATRAVPALLSGAMLRAVEAPATLPFDEIVERLNVARPMMLQGYPSILTRLAAARRSGRLTIAPIAVTATSETLPPDLRADLGDAFGVPVTDQFGSSEGLVGVSPPGTEGIMLADDLTIVELVDDDDRPVPVGTPSQAVLVTSLTNLAQPLIRYRIEDRMVQLPAPPGQPWTVVRVEGRSDDVLHFGERSLHPLVVRTVFAHRAEVLEYQVRQVAEGIEIDAVLADAVPDAREERTTARTVDELTGQVRAALVRAGLAGLTVRVRPVDAVPRDPASGKARRFVPG